MGQKVAPTDDWASLTINQVVDTNGSILGYILVMNPDRPDAKWKFAGGHKEPGETPLETAVRENKGETGLRLPPEAYTELEALLEWRRNHWSVLFLAKVAIDQVRLLNEHDIGNEGEIVRYFTLAELDVEIRHGTILGSHLRKLQQAVQLAA
jgi:8-oxo-dGTP pyrophosphatase MutT (NUDIX family)